MSEVGVRKGEGGGCGEETEAGGRSCGRKEAGGVQVLLRGGGGDEERSKGVGRGEGVRWLGNGESEGQFYGVERPMPAQRAGAKKGAGQGSKAD